MNTIGLTFKIVSLKTICVNFCNKKYKNPKVLKKIADIEGVSKERI